MEECLRNRKGIEESQKFRWTLQDREGKEEAIRESGEQGGNRRGSERSGEIERDREGQGENERDSEGLGGTGRESKRLRETW